MQFAFDSSAVFIPTSRRKSSTSAMTWVAAETASIVQCHVQFDLSTSTVGGATDVLGYSIGSVAGKQHKSSQARYSH